MAKANKIVLDETQCSEIERLVESLDGDGFVMVAQGDLPSAIPLGLAGKMDSAVFVVSGSAGDRAIAMWNGYRIDQRPQAVDEHPIAIMMISGSVQPEAVILDHGGWDGRTTPLSDEHKRYILNSGVGDYFLSQPPEGVPSGSLGQLSPGRRDAFEQCVNELEIMIE